MEEITTEQTQVHNTGKFDSVDDLLAAYNALESEFTKRCQLVKQLQAELFATRAQAEQAAVDCTSSGDGTSVEPVGEEITATSAPADPTDDAIVVPDEILRDAERYAEILSAIPEVMNACIAQYKKKLASVRNGFAAPQGMAVIAPAARPKTLSDAKKLADKMLNS